MVARAAPGPDAGSPGLTPRTPTRVSYLRSVILWLPWNSSASIVQK